MAAIRIRILEKPIVEPGSDGIFNLTKVIDDCFSLYTLEVRTSSSCWFSIGAPIGGWIITKNSGNFEFVDGETLTENTLYTVRLAGFMSPRAILNTKRYTTTIQIKSSEFGGITSSQTYSRYATDLPCLYD